MVVWELIDADIQHTCSIYSMFDIFDMISSIDIRAACLVHPHAWLAVFMSYLKGSQLAALQLAEAFSRAKLLRSPKKVQPGAQTKLHHVTYPVAEQALIHSSMVFTFSLLMVLLHPF